MADSRSDGSTGECTAMTCVALSVTSTVGLLLPGKACEVSAVTNVSISVAATRAVQPNSRRTPRNALPAGSRRRDHFGVCKADMRRSSRLCNFRVRSKLLMLNNYHGTRWRLDLGQFVLASQN